MGHLVNWYNSVDIFGRLEESGKAMGFPTPPCSARRSHSSTVIRLIALILTTAHNCIITESSPEHSGECSSLPGNSPPSWPEVPYLCCRWVVCCRQGGVHDDTGAGAGLVWLTGRVVYSLGYYTGEPKNRLYGFFVSLISLQLVFKSLQGKWLSELDWLK